MKHFKKALFLLPTLLLASCNFTYTYVIDGFIPSANQGDFVDDTDDAGSYDIKVWVDDKIESLTKMQIQSFISENLTPEGRQKYNLTVRVEPMSEGNATSSMLQDVTSGADIFVFAQDQLARLKVAGALAKLPNNYVNDTKKNHSEDSVNAASLGSNVYAFPMTSDNGYFLYYDKAVLSDDDVKDMSTMLAKIKAYNDKNGTTKRLYFKAQSDGFYSASYFLATGCTSDWEINTETGQFLSYVDTFSGDNGFKAAKGIQEINDKTLVVNTDNSASKFNDDKGAAAVVTGIWDYETALGRLGKDRLGCAELPYFSVGSEKFHLGSYDGYKLMGVKPQVDAKKASVCRRLARYLTSEICQTQRFKEVSWGPTNKKSNAKQDVIDHPGLAALAKQHEYATQQGQCPGAWFVALSTMAKSITKDLSDDGIRAVLNNYKNGLDELLSEDQEVKQ